MHAIVSNISEMSKKYRWVSFASRTDVVAPTIEAPDEDDDDEQADSNGDDEDEEADGDDDDDDDDEDDYEVGRR